jgi:hypothetical protein
MRPTRSSSPALFAARRTNRPWMPSTSSDVEVLVRFWSSAKGCFVRFRPKSAGEEPISLRNERDATPQASQEGLEARYRALPGEGRVRRDDAAADDARLIAEELLGVESLTSRPNLQSSSGPPPAQRSNARTVAWTVLKKQARPPLHRPSPRSCARTTSTGHGKSQSGAVGGRWRVPFSPFRESIASIGGSSTRYSAASLLGLMHIGPTDTESRRQSNA